MLYVQYSQTLRTLIVAHNMTCLLLRYRVITIISILALALTIQTLKVGPGSWNHVIWFWFLIYSNVNRSFIEDSGAGIKISPQDNNYIGLTDRVVTLTGSFEEQMRATDLIISKLTEDPLYLQSMNAPLSYPGVLFGGFQRGPYAYVHPPVGPAAYNSNYGHNGVGGRYPNNKEDRGNSLTIGVADEHIGVVVGRGGRNILEINQASGARIKISDRGDFMSGTSNRKVTITGSLRAIRTAEAMINQKVASVTER